MRAIEELTIALFEGRRTAAKLGSIAARSRNLPLRVSRLARSTALWVARRSAVFALRDERLRGAGWFA
jgi:hypothetical protein